MDKPLPIDDEGPGTPGRRFPSLYVTLWGVAAGLALAYLTLVAVRPDLADRVLPVQRTASGDGGRAVGRLSGDVQSLRQTAAKLEKEVGDLRALIVAHDARGADFASRIAALETQLRQAAAGTTDAARKAAPDLQQPVTSAIPAPPAPTPPAPAPMAAVEPPAAAVQPVPAAPAPTAPAAKSESDGATGWATAAKAAPVAVTLSTGPSLDVLRLSWQVLQETSRSAVRHLKPRYLPAEDDPESFQLIAGPIVNRTEAQRVCDRLKGKVECSIRSAFEGKPL